MGNLVSPGVYRIFSTTEDISASTRLELCDQSTTFVMNVVSIEVSETKRGEVYYRLVSDNVPDDGRRVPTGRWFGGLNKLLALAPWLAESATKEELAEVGASYPFGALVTYETNSKGYPRFVSMAQA